MITLESLLESSPKIEYTIEQLTSVLEIFKTQCSFTPYTEDEISRLLELFEFGDKTIEYLRKVGQLKVGNFTVPNIDELIKLTGDWRSIVTKGRFNGNRYFVIESDNGEYTLVDSNDNIIIYNVEKKKFTNDESDTITHLTKHILSELGEKNY